MWFITKLQFIQGMKVTTKCSLSSPTLPLSHRHHLLSPNNVHDTALDTLQILYIWLLKR